MKTRIGPEWGTQPRKSGTIIARLRGCVVRGGADLACAAKPVPAMLGESDSSFSTLAPLLVHFRRDNRKDVVGQAEGPAPYDTGDPPPPLRPMS